MKSLKEFQDEIRNCQSCDLCKLDRNSFDRRLVPNGYLKSNFMILGMSPSSNSINSKIKYFFEDDVDNEAFIKNKFLLVNLLNRFSIDFDTAWKTNVQKCADDSNKFNEKFFNRCFDENFIKEIETVNPKMIFCLGNNVSSKFDELKDKKFGELAYSKKYSCILVKTFHPSFCVRGSITQEKYIEHLDNISTDIKKIVFENNFINLHHHNQFSVRDGVGKEKEIVERLYELKSPGFCLTNHGNISAHFRQYESCKKYGLKPVFGNEIYYTPHAEEIAILNKNEDEESIKKRKELAKETYHLTVIAKNKKGYYNLISMTNDSWMNYFYKFPRISDNILEKYKDGLIIFSGCIGSYISKKLIGGNIKEAYEKAQYFKKIFKDDFYIELQLTEYEPQKEANIQLIKLAKDLNLKCVLTNDTHYINAGDDSVQQVMILNNQGKNVDDLNDPNSKAWKFEVKDLYIKNIKNLKRDFKNKYENDDIFTEKEFNNSILNTNCVFSQIEKFEIDSSIKLPKIYDNSIKKFNELIKLGILEKNINFKNKKFQERLRYEYRIITDMNFVDYFLILQDVISWTKKTFGKFSVGPGRGSAAGSLINYLLSITDLNPLKFPMLLFERFLSPGRKDVPDIDIDFSPEIRDKVKQYIINRFGRDYVCSIGNYQTIKVKSAIQDVFRTLNLPFSDVLTVTKEIGNLSPEEEELSVNELRKKYKEFNKLVEKYPESINYIDKLKGQIRGVGQHAAGVVVSSVKLTENIPLVMTSSKEIVSANTEGGDYHELTSMGFVKYDILSLMTLKNINDCCGLIKKNHDIELNWNEFDCENKDMYDLLISGDTYGIFQFSSPLATNYLKEMKPQNLNDLCVASALLRPGPLDQNVHIDYYKRKNGEIKYSIHDCLKDILSETMGIIVYQEQILRICQELADFSKEEANVFRKALVKYEKSPDHEKKRREKVSSFSQKLINGLRRYMTEEQSIELWNLIESFARYGFNYAHSLSYALLSQRQLYQKYYFPLEFYCSILNNEDFNDYSHIIKKINKNKQNIVDYKIMKVIDSKKINILTPDFRKFNSNWTIENNCIRQGFSKLKWFSESSCDLFVKNMNDKIKNDFNELIKFKIRDEEKNRDKYLVTKKIFEALLYSGSIDYMNPLDKNEKIEIYNKIRKSNVKTIENDEELREYEKEFTGYTLKNNENLLFIRNEIISKLKNKPKYILNELIDIDSEFEQRAVDSFRLISFVKKKTRTDKDYHLIEVEVPEGKFSKIYLWKQKLEIKKDHLYIGTFLKRSGFTSLESFNQID